MWFLVILRPRSRFKLNVSAGSQKRTIHKPEGKDESRFSLKSKKNRNVTIVKYILSLLGQIVSLLGQTNCVGLRTLCQKRLLAKNIIPLIRQKSFLEKTKKGGWARDVTTEGGSGGGGIPPAFTRTTITSKSPSEAVFIIHHHSNHTL